MSEITHRTLATNGIQMHVAEAGEGPLVVLCHGFPESWYSWRHQLVALADAGYHVVAPDLRGYGDTDKPEAIEAYTQQHIVGDVVGLVAGLGEEQAVVVGHDWGAMVAYNAAAWRPDVFRAVATLSVPASPRTAMPPTQMFRMIFGDRFFYILYFQTPGVAEHELQHDVTRSVRQFLYGASGDAPEREFDFANLPPSSAYFLDQFEDCEKLPDWLSQEDLDYFVEEFRRNGFRGPLNWYRNFDRSWELSAPFAGRTIDQPAAFISGDRDLIRGMPGWEATMRTVVTDLRELTILPGIGHWTQQEAPAETNAALLRFLEGLA